MKKSHFNMLDDKGRIGLTPTLTLEAETVDCNDKYAEFEIKRLTKANSFLVLDEVFYIAKKDFRGKASILYHVYRVSDKRYVCPSAKSKEDTISMVQRKYMMLD